MRPVSFMPGGCIIYPRSLLRLGCGGLVLVASPMAIAASAAPAPPPAYTPPPAAAPTQNVPLGVRPLLGPPVVISVGAFTVEAPDYASAQAVLNLAQHLRTILGKDFAWPDFSSGVIHVALVPLAQASFARPFGVTQNQDGSCTALVRWGPNTSLADVCLALGSVTVESIATKQGGAATHAPEWLKLAFGKMLEAETKPAIMDELAADARREPILTLRQIMTAQNPAPGDVPLLTLNSFWLARFLADQCVTSAGARQLFGPLATGADPAETIAKAFPGRFTDARDLELWWEVGYRDLASQHLSPVLSLAQSRTLLDRLEYLDLARPNGLVQRIRLDDAWASRADKTLQQHLADFMLTAGPLPLQINPVYKNTLLSLLRTLTAMSGNDQGAFKSAWTQYLADRADADTIAAGVEKAMSGQ